MRKKVLLGFIAVMILTVFPGCGILRALTTTQAQNQPVTTQTTQTTQTTTQPVVQEDEEIGFTTPTISPTITSTYCSDEVENSLKSLQTDYNKVAWGVRYSPLTSVEGVVVSVTMYQESYGGWDLIVAYTNLYDTPISISASGYAKNSEGGQNGSIYTNIEALGPGSTHIDKVLCTEMPTGEIHWDAFETKEPVKDYVTWVADYNGTRSAYEAIFDYKITNAEAADVNKVVMLVVDEQGRVIDMGMSFPEETQQTQYVGSILCFAGALQADKMDVCVFANPTK